MKEKSRSLFGAKHAQVADIESSEEDVAEEEEVSESKKLRQQTAIVESRTDLDDESAVNDKDAEAKMKEQVAIAYVHVDWICSVCGKENLVRCTPLSSGTSSSALKANTTNDLQ